jgi:ATP-dependent Clp protease ATP-binding subunit ClpA
VHAARRDARSWTQIGEALGVTKQAAQQRFVSDLAEPPRWPDHFVPAAREVVAAALREARAMRHRYLGTEHLLLALTGGGDLAATTLTRLGVTREVVRSAIVREVGTGHSSESATLGITPRTKRTFDAARKEAKRLGHRCADSEHLLLALSAGEGVAAQMLRALGIDDQRVRSELAELLAGEAPELAAKVRVGPARRRLRRSRE